MIFPCKKCLQEGVGHSIHFSTIKTTLSKILTVYLKMNNGEQKLKFDLGKVKARVDRVNVNGLLRTHNDYVVKTAEALFNANTFQDVMVESMNTKKYLNELGIFKDIDIRIDVSKGHNASPNGYEVTFKGKELSRINGSIGTEVGQCEGSMRLECIVPNILGRGESISLQGAYSSTRAHDVTLKFWKSFYHTKFHKNRPEFSVSIFRQLDRFDISSFQNSNLGLNTEFAFNSYFPLKLVHSLQYESAIREISLQVRNAPFKIRDQCGPRLSSLIRYSVIYDERESRILPSSGFMLRTSTEYCGLGGNINYISSTTHAEISVPLFAGLVAQLCGRIGILKETKSDLPLNNLFYCGGPLTLRGFAFGGAGPVVDGTPIGAQKNWTIGLHLWTPLPFNSVFKSLGNNFRTHLFYNFGNFNAFTLDNMRASVGIGVAYKLAERARVEINYCLPFRKYPGDKVTNGFQFGIGYEFV